MYERIDRRIITLITSEIADGRTDERTDRQGKLNGRILKTFIDFYNIGIWADGRTDGQTDGRTDRRTDKAS